MRKLALLSVLLLLGVGGALGQGTTTPFVPNMQHPLLTRMRFWYRVQGGWINNATMTSIVPNESMTLIGGVAADDTSHPVGGEGSLVLTAATQYGSVPAAVADVTTGDFSVVTWARRDSGSGDGTVFYKGCRSSTAGHGNGWNIFYESASGIINACASSADTNGQFSIFRTNGGLAQGAWTHLAMTKNGSSITVYFNGIPQSGGYSFCCVTSLGTMTTIATLFVGSTYDPAGNLNSMGGRMDDVMMFDRWLSDGEVATLYTQSLMGYPDMRLPTDDVSAYSAVAATPTRLRRKVTSD